MKLIDIALKDMLRYFRSAFALGMMLIIPLLITGLIYFAFGGVLTSSETAAYSLPVIKIQAVNMDAGDAQSKVNLGDVLVSALKDPSVKDVFAVTSTTDEAAARAAVEQQQAALALIIPANFTDAALNGKDSAAVEIYQDPTLSFGPGITKEVLAQFLDAFTGGQIATGILKDQFAARGQTASPELVQASQTAYGEWFKTTTSEKTWNLPVIKRLPNRETPKSVADHRTTLLGPVMAGMLIFFVFFTGVNTAQSILTEQEQGTLARMFTTPTPLPVIFGGKFGAVFLTLLVQSIVLCVASALIFQIHWGNLLALALVIFGLVVSASGFGILLISLIKNSQQAGALSGGLLAMMGMVGGLFTTGFGTGPTVFDTIGLALPQGWALRGMKLVLAGASPLDALLPMLALLAFGAVFFAVGTRIFRTRFA